MEARLFEINEHANENERTIKINRTSEAINNERSNTDARKKDIANPARETTRAIIHWVKNEVVVSCSVSSPLPIEAAS